MRRVVVTPAGRKRYLELLYKHLNVQKKDFDEWILLVNTTNVEDIGYCERLAARNDWIETRYAKGSDPAQGNLNIHRFLNEFCREPDTLYVRLDDDICFLAPGFVKTLADFKEQNSQYFLVYGNIINNAILSWVHTKFGSLKTSRSLTYECMCDAGWKDGKIAEEVHRAFLEDPDDPKWTAFDRWVATEYERISVNAICWAGADLQEAPVAPDEEHWFSVERPKQLGLPNAICGSALCVHFAFHTQRGHLDTTDILKQYSQIGVLG